jgi:hypothetical protein
MARMMKNGLERNLIKMQQEFTAIRKGMKGKVGSQWWIPFSHDQIDLPVEASRLSPYWIGHVLYYSVLLNVGLVAYLVVAYLY